MPVQIIVHWNNAVKFFCNLLDVKEIERKTSQIGIPVSIQQKCSTATESTSNKHDITLKFHSQLGYVTQVRYDFRMVFTATFPRKFCKELYYLKYRELHIKYMKFYCPVTLNSTTVSYGNICA
jgi:hypothetical protein